MADKKDLSEAQSYSRRRLVTAFTSGIPSGVELTPKKNQTPVIVGVGLALIAILVSVFYGIMSPSLPAGWENNKLIVAKDSAARYVSVNGTLHPVINAISARLLIPSSDFDVITVKDDQLAGKPIGSTIGILGAPDALPAKDQLAAGSITSCADGPVDNLISGSTIPVLDERQAIVATVDGDDYLIAGSTHYKLPKQSIIRDSFLRALGVPQTNTIHASAQWLNLFRSGDPIDIITVPGEGDTVTVRGTTLTVGGVITQQGDASGTRYLVLEDGSVTALDDLAYNLYVVGKPETLAKPRTVGTADFQQLKNASSGVIPSDWPTSALRPVDDGATMCATFPLSSGSGTLGSRVRLAVAPQSLKSDGGTGTTRSDTKQSDGPGLDETPTVTTRVTGGTGALVRASIGDSGKGTVFAIDSTGTAYPIPNATEEILNRLGYTGKDVHAIPRAWVDVFPTGVQLTPAAAGDAPNPQAVIDQTGGTR
ncbi:type VII secretion protein EccB [Bifidobacterium sp. CP2]|uniref:type VII secretion protein EccB n=1 Tax=Bifidobacterium sp. CP2 TaxID=2809025 RepID=UPI001BDC3A06|nr:type VII secretion protein EccB [Bifidobacterium sp. CP2]MBT1181090.1 type VII secretion protein EccB [Bifidobacterium sp. CP2]